MIGVTLAVFGGWMINTMVEFTRAVFERIPTLFT
ncbi:MAG: flagellar biosynthetic protein FliQ [Burkholderiaceae bacterium]